MDFVTPGTGPKPYSSGIVSSGGVERLRRGEGDFRAEVDVVGERMLEEEEAGRVVEGEGIG